MPDTTVKYFASTMSGAMALSGTAGALISVLDACLLSTGGFGSVTLNSLVVASNVATGTVSGGHNFAMIGNTGPVIQIAGATPSGLNGQWRIASVPGSTTFTFATTGISDQTATGTITAKRAPAGWTKLYSGTNKAVYQRTAAGATAMLLRVDDSTTTYATINAYESMSDVDTGTNGFGGTLYIRKSQTADNNSRTWRLFADANALYLFPYWHSSYSTHTEGIFFGDIVSLKIISDNYHCGIIASAINNSPYPGGNGTGQNDFRLLSSGVGHYIARGYNQSTLNSAFTKRSHNLASTIVGGAGVAYPDVLNAGLITAPCEVYETSAIRGTMPGLYVPIHAKPGADGDVIAGGPLGREVQLVLLSYQTTDYGRAAMDITGPWR
jgi:hypothetical protein